MGKFKLVYSDFQEDSGESYVIIEYKGKAYTGRASYNRDDSKEYPTSSFLGCRIAEKRACIKALTEELKRKKADFKCYQNSYCLLTESPFEDNLDTIVAPLRKKIDNVYADIKYREKVIKNIEESIDVDINNFIKFQKKKESCE